MALPGISNANEFYSAHYLESVLTGDIKKVRERWEHDAKAQLEENPLAEVERLRRAKAALLKTGGEEDEVGCGVATDVLYDTGTSFLALPPRLVVEMLDRRIATME